MIARNNDIRLANLPGQWTPEERRQQVYELWKQGVSEAELAERFGCSSATVRRDINLERYSRLTQAPIEYVASDEFALPDADAVILGDPPETPQTTGSNAAPKQGPAYLRALYRFPLLSAEQETYWFRRMNYLKYKAAQKLAKINPRHPAKRDLDEVEELRRQAMEARNLLVRHNLRLVASIARKNAADSEELFERISEGNAALMRSVDKFDYTRGFKLSTYATWAIRKALAGRWRRMAKQADRFPTVAWETLNSCEFDGQLPWQVEQEHATMRQQLFELLHQLDDRDQTVLSHRFGLVSDGNCETLHEIGERIGVSKERVRQIEQRALRRLKYLALREQPELVDSLSA